MIVFRRESAVVLAMLSCSLRPCVLGPRKILIFVDTRAQSPPVTETQQKISLEVEAWFGGGKTKHSNSPLTSPTRREVRYSFKIVQNCPLSLFCVTFFSLAILL